MRRHPANGRPRSAPPLNRDAANFGMEVCASNGSPDSVQLDDGFERLPGLRQAISKNPEWVRLFKLGRSLRDLTSSLRHCPGRKVTMQYARKHEWTSFYPTRKSARLARGCWKTFSIKRRRTASLLVG